MVLTAVSTGVAQSAPSPNTVQLSVTTGGFAPGDGGNGGGRGTERRLLSDDGRYVVFESSGPVVPGQQQLEWQIVLRDRHLGTTKLISKNSAGIKANAGNSSPSISADGKVIAFHSYASNLVAGDTNNQSDVFVHDVRTGKTTRASVTSSGAQVSVPGSATNIVGPPSISADGRHVGFTSRAAGLAPGDNAQSHAYLRDLQARTTEVVSISKFGAVVDASTSTAVSVSADGNLVAFQSGNANVVSGDTNGDPDIFVRNRALGTTTVIPDGEDGGYAHSMSPDGRFVVFQTSTNNLVTGDNNGKDDIFVHDRNTATTSRVSVGSGGTEANGHSRIASISNDGNRVTFISDATNLVPGDTNGQADAFLHDRSTNQTTRVSVANNGAQNSYSSRSPALSGDGKHVVFDSHGRSLTSIDTKTWSQVFVRDLAGTYPALHARIGALPARVAPGAKYRVTTRDIRTGPALAVTWKRMGGGGVVRRSEAVSGNAFTLRAPTRGGKYAVTVSYAGNQVGGRTIVAIKPSAKALPKKLKAGQKLKVRTVGVAQGQRIQVVFKPQGKGKTVKRSTKVNKAGVATVKTAKRGTYTVTVRTNGMTLRKGKIRIG